MPSKLNVEKLVGITANLGVIAGLVLVAYQINQSVEITRAQMLNDYFIADMQLEMKMMGENPQAPFSKAIYDPGSLSQEDLVVLDRYFNFGLVQIGRLLEMQKLGYVSGADVENRLRYLGWHFGNPAGRLWWEHVRKTYPPEHVERIEAAIRTRADSENQEVLNSMARESVD